MLPSKPNRLRIFFRNSLRKGSIKNAELDPTGSSAVVSAIEAGERIVVRVESRVGTRYWFTDRRLLQENGSGSWELLRYEDVRSAYWMFKDLPDRMKKVTSPEETEQLKARHYDRIEIEVQQGRLLAMEGLSDAYSPTLRFLQWITRS